VGVHLADSPNKMRPHSILVDDSNTDSLRRYKVIFSGDEEPTTKEYTFTVEGTGPLRTITWSHGSYTATWASKNWTLSKPFPADLEPLLMCIIRLDEAIHLELMPYAMIAD
jgi:hypothetical protein